MDEVKDLVFIVGVISLVIINIIKFFRKNKSEVHKLVTTVNKNVQIYPILWKMLVKYKASRVIIFQFHDGTDYYSANSMQRMSISHEVIDDDKAKPITPKFTDVPLSENMSDTLVQLSRFGKMYVRNIDSDTKISEKYKRVLRVYDVDSIMSVSLLNKEKQIVGVLSLHFKKCQPLSSINRDELISWKSEIENILNKV